MAERTIRDIDLGLGSDDFTRDELRLIAQTADYLGIGNIYITEGRGRDAFSVLTDLALHTERVGLGTGIVNVFSRTPTALAQCTGTVMELMGDRTFNLGLGTSGKLLMQKYHGADFERPVSRLRETIHVIDHAFRTGNLPSDGTIFRLEDMPLGVKAPRDRLKIFVAGLSPRTIEVVGQDADGWLPIWFSSSRGREQVQMVETAAREAGRPRPSVAAFLYGSVGTNPKYYEYTRDTMTWYIAAQGTAYRHQYELFGYNAEVEKICGLWSSGDRKEARRQTPEYMVQDTALLGDPETFLAQVDRFIKAGIDRPVLRLQSQPTAAESIEMLVSLAGATYRADD